MRTRYEVIQVIWDVDHGTRNEGWYIRTKEPEGIPQDDVNSPLNDEPRDISDGRVKMLALLWLTEPDGMNLDELQELEQLIEVRR